MILFFIDLKQHHLYVQGVTSRLLLEKVTYDCLEVPYVDSIFKHICEKIFNPHINKRDFKWWYERKSRPLVGFL